MLAGFITTLISFWIWGRNIIIPGVVALYAVVPGFIASTAVTLLHYKASFRNYYRALKMPSLKLVKNFKFFSFFIIWSIYS
ncbi:MAG: hypothetical protein RMI53_04370 [Nitrososphaerota archaeon]|nr:hypothetical protein [Nitrososphaerota archaeon]